MPRRKGPPPYRFHKGSNQAFVLIEGRFRYLGLYGSEESKQKYEEIIRQAESDAAHLAAKADAERRVLAAADLSVIEIVGRYLDFASGYYRKNGKPTSEYSNICAALRPVREQCQGMPARLFGPLKLKAFRQQLIDTGIVRKQVNGRIDRIRRMFAWAVSEELVPSYVYEALKTVKGHGMGRSMAKEGAKVRPVEESVVDATLPGLNRQVRAMVQLQRLTGMRSSEVCIMRTRDLDMGGQVWLYTPESHKTEHHGHSRKIFLGPQAVELLRPWLRANRDECLFQPREAEAERKESLRATRKSRVQPSQRNRRKNQPRKQPGEFYTKDSYRRAITLTLGRINRARAKQGFAPLPHWHPHQLGHTAGTRIRKEFGLETVKAVLVHHCVILELSVPSYRAEHAKKSHQTPTATE